MHRTPILRESGNRQGSAGTAADGSALDAASFCALPREQAEGDAHPLAPPRIKQRARRSMSISTTTTTASARRRAPSASRSSSAPGANAVGVGDDDLFSAAFGGSHDNTAGGTMAGGADTSRVNDDPLSQLWLPPPPPPPVVPGPPGGGGDGGLAGSGTTSPPAAQAPLFEDDERVSACQGDVQSNHGSTK